MNGEGDGRGESLTSQQLGAAESPWEMCARLHGTDGLFNTNERFNEVASTCRTLSELSADKSERG